MKDTDNFFILVKFIEEQYIDSFIDDGCIHFSTIEDIQKLETESGNTIQGDKFEGVYSVELNPNEVMLFYRIEGSNDAPRRLPFTKARTNTRNKSVDKMQIASFAALNIRTDFDWIGNTENGKKVYKIKHKILNGMESISGKRPCAIIPFDAFRETFTQYAENKIASFSGLVNYKNYTNRNDDVATKDLSSLEFAKKIAFTKRIKYKKQREFRILLPKNGTDENGNLQIGSLADQESVKKLKGIDELAEYSFVVLEEKEKV